MDEALNRQLQYQGTKQPEHGEIDRETGQLLYPYLPSAELIEAVNLAIFVERPLLLKGEPGCGKTRLAQAVAYELSLPFETWNVKSTSRARDGLYTYDAVGRLRDAQLATTNRLSKEKLAQIDLPETYVRWGALGKAFQNPDRTIVLIDEIDKADIDFPNDLLLELDEKRFVVEETGQSVKAEKPPIVFITSNDEKDLPDAFLRRCLFHFVEFPSKEQLTKIIQAHFTTSPEQLIEKVIDRFLELRDLMKKDKGDSGKKISTSELMDWVKVLSHYPEDQVLSQLSNELMYPGMLLKTWDDYRVYPQKMKTDKNG